jgi:MoxR-like ATPase
LSEKKENIKLLGETVKEKVKRKRGRPKGSKNKKDYREQDISKGVIVYVPRDEVVNPKSLPKVVVTKQIAEINILTEAHLDSGQPLLLEGPKGQCKTLVFATWFAKRGIPFIQHDCSEQTKRYDLIGRFIPVDSQIVFQLGDLPRAIEMANKHGAAALCCEELTGLTPNMQKVLNQLFDYRRHVYVPELGRTFSLNPGAKLALLATCNPPTYGGTFELNEDLKSRLTIYKVHYPVLKEEQHIIRQLFKKHGEVVSEYIDPFVKLADETRRGYNKNEFTYALSTRDVAQLIENFISYINVFEKKKDDDAEYQALQLVRTVFLSKYEKAERETLETRWRSIIGGTII